MEVGQQYGIVARDETEHNSQSKEQKHNRKRNGLIACVCVIIVIVVIVLCAVLIPAGQANVEVKYHGFQVLPRDEVICINSLDLSSYENYTNALDELIPAYEHVELKGKVVDCRKKDPTVNEICYIKDSWFFPCKKDNQWGYADMKPCVILTYQDDPTFTPTAYKTLDEMTAIISPEFKANIEEEVEDNEVFNDKLVRIYCTGLENVDYFPDQGFLEPFFRTANNSGYLHPIVALRFDLRDKDEIETECTLWPKTPSRQEVVKRTIKIKKGNC